jgi:hypothetical protein
MLRIKLKLLSVIGRVLGIAFKVDGLPYGSTPRPTVAAHAASQGKPVEFR